MKQPDFITAKQIVDIEGQGRCVHIYPRKHMALVDGFKYFKINAATLARYQYFKRHGVLITEPNR